MLLKHTSRQTWVLMQKNLRIYARSPLTTLVRALIFPILATILLCLSKQLGETDLIAGFVDKSGIATSSQPIKALADAISATSNQKLVFVRNGVAAGYVDPIIDGVMVQPNMENKTHVVLDDPSNLFLECQQTLRGLSNCFAAVIFTSYNNTNAEYIIAVDSSVGAMDADQKAHTSVAIDRLMPLKWAIDSQIGNFTTTTRPAELPWQGIIASRDSIITTAQSALTNPPNPWFNFIGLFIAPVFLLPLMGIVYHLSLSVATERQSGISELLAAHTCSTTPRILSTLLSFTLLYLPGWVGCSVLITRLLFKRCSDILFLILTLLATLAMTSSTHLVASFFRKAQLSGLYTSTLMFALAFVTIAFTMDRNPNLLSIQILSGIFPPIAYATLIGDIARAETRSTGYSLSVSDVPVKVHSYDYVYPQFAGYFYAIFFTVQIVVYTAATFGVEKYLWGVKRPFNIIPANSDVALRCIKLSKTFDAKCHWYWPFNTASRTSVVAVNDLDFDLRKGSVSFLLGPNGGGKTTTLKCIAGMTVMDPTSSLEINEDSLAFGVCPQGNVSIILVFAF
jgi:ATP-binding cassette subfamily A (ABC1) protein 3